MDNRLNVSFKNSGSYEVVFENSYDALPSHISDLFPNLKKICIITDSNVAGLYLEEVRNALSKCCDNITEFVFDAGEEHKNLTTVKSCYDRLVADDFNRRDLVVGLGGGVTGDIAAYIASTYMRGCAFVNLPTTLLAMADSSVGGKCGVDYDGYKNLIGSIYMPRLVYAATDTLRSLDDSEFSSGMAEVIKSALIRDGVFYEWLIENFDRIMEKDGEYLRPMLFKAVGIKQYYVTKDPYEENERMILNLGHTIGHALEKHFEFGYSHGQCVAFGTIAASYISFKRNMLSKEEFYEIRDMFVPFGLSIAIDNVNIYNVCENIAHDKKNTDTGLKFILLKKIGKAVITNDVTEDEIKAAIRKLIVEWD